MADADGRQGFECGHCGHELMITITWSPQGMAPLIFCPDCDMLPAEPNVWEPTDDERADDGSV